MDAADAVSAPRLPARFIKSGEMNLDDDVLTEYLDPESDLFFAATESADLVLTRDA